MHLCAFLLVNPSFVTGTSATNPTLGKRRNLFAAPEVKGDRAVSTTTLLATCFNAPLTPVTSDDPRPEDQTE